MLAADFVFSIVENRRRITAAVARGEERAGKKIGAFIRRRVRTDILKRTAGKGSRASVKRVKNGVRRKVQKTARPGAPPIIRTKSKIATLKNIRFAYSKSDRVVYIGPVGLPDRRLKGSSQPTAAALLERGGTGRVEQWKPKNSNVWSLGSVRSRNTDRRSARAKYAKHPFMGPGLEKEIAAGTIPQQWHGEAY